MSPDKMVSQPPGTASTNSPSSTLQHDADSVSNLEKGEKTPEAPGTDDVSAGEFPDGGWRAWIVAAGTAGALFCTLGYSNTFGIFQAWYSFHQMTDKSPDDIAWIGSIQAFLIFAVGAFAGPLFDRYGVWVLRPATVVYVFAIMMTSICKSYYQFMLAQGILTGLADGLIIVPAMGAVSQWFDKRRGAAMGIAIAGSSLGGVIFPIVLSRLLSTVGFAWAVRIVGFIMLPVLLFVCITVRPRLPPRKTNFFLWEAFHNRMYVLLIFAVFFGMIGMFVPMFLLPTYAIKHGMSESLANYLVAIINAASIFGRIIPGVLADKIGRINTLSAAGFASAIMIFCWPLAKSNEGIIVFAGFFGFCSGAIVSGGAVAITMCADQPKNIGTYMGVGMALSSLGSLMGPPVSGALIDKYGGFHEVSYFAGTMTLCGGIIAVVAKANSPLGLFRRT